MNISTALESWYAAHESIRHLWAIENPAALMVFVRLEPTADGDDTLPVWLARNEDWAHDLRRRTNREVHLRLIVSDVFSATDEDTSSAMVAELGWRDPWYFDA